MGVYGMLFDQISPEKSVGKYYFGQFAVFGLAYCAYGVGPLGVHLSNTRA
jgi:hypothetical protein